MSIFLIAGLAIVAVIVVAALMTNKKAPSEQAADLQTGNEAANKPTVGYKHPCKFCGKLIPPNSVSCPFCGKVNPQGPLRCPKCHNPIEKDWTVCSACNLKLETICLNCGAKTFFGDYCEKCNERLVVKCPNCKTEQPFFKNECKNCGTALVKTLFCQQCKAQQIFIKDKCMVCGAIFVKEPNKNANQAQNKPASPAQNVAPEQTNNNQITK